MNSDRIEGSAKEVGGKVQETFGHVTGDPEIRAGGVARQIEGKGQNLYGRGKDGLRDAADLAEQAFDEGSRHVKRGSREIGEKVGDHPLPALLLAGAVGFVAGILFRRG
jgi:uncharacterized protein YjbJ (UPF0337 family)